MLPSKIRMVLWPTMPAPLTSVNSMRLPLGAMMTRLCVNGGLGADAEQARQELRRRLRRRAQSRLDLDQHEIGARFAHRDASHQQRPDIDARRALVDAHVGAFLIHIDPVGAESAGNRAVHVLDPERDLAQALGQARDGETQAGLGVDHPGEEQQQYQDNNNPKISAAILSRRFITISARN